MRPRPAPLVVSEAAPRSIGVAAHRDGVSVRERIVVAIEIGVAGVACGAAGAEASLAECCDIFHDVRVSENARASRFFFMKFFP